jgi:prevent-host-death family protein
VYIGVMIEKEVTVRELRAHLADHLNEAGVHDTIAYVTSNGRRIAAVVPLHVADSATQPRPPA